MDRYIGTKLLNAVAMPLGQYNNLQGWKLPEGQEPDTPGYLVEYLDGGKPNHPDFAGYISWSPKDVFERAYQPTSGMDFGCAIAAMKIGMKVCRAGWNGKGMFAYLVPAASYPAQTGAAISHFGEGALVPYNAYMAIKNVDHTVSTWVPSVNDCLATDWKIVD